MFWINGLIFIAFVVASVVIWFSFNRIETVVTKRYADTTERIINNSQVSRKLARLIREISYVVNTFFQNGAVLQGAGDRFSQSAAELSGHLDQEALRKTFNRALGISFEVIDQCGDVDSSRGKILDIQNQLQETLTALDQVVADRIIMMMTEGREAYHLEQVSVELAGYQESIIRLALAFDRQGLDYFQKPMDPEKSPMVAILDDLELRFQSLSAYHEEIVALGVRLSEHLDAYRVALDQLHADAGVLAERVQTMSDAIQSLMSAIDATDQAIERSVQEDVGSIRQRISWSATVVFGLSVIVFFFVCAGLVMSRRLSGTLKTVSGNLKETSDHVFDAASQISRSGRLLSESAANEAAAMEETSSSMEEMTSMADQNSSSAQSMAKSIQEVQKRVRVADAAMGELKTSIEETIQANQDTSNIIKSIDEIAFQTNLLALNAAVEAARAGELGAGFAVVADEVRNLAIRATEAAKNTTGLIEGSLTKSKAGSEALEKANAAFQEAAALLSHVAQSVQDVAVASDEQSQGFAQVSRAVTDMDRMIQQNAAEAEASASVSMTLEQWAEELDGCVSELLSLTGKTAGSGDGGGIRSEDAPAPSGPGRAKRLTGGEGKVVGPQDRLPL